MANTSAERTHRQIPSTPGATDAGQRVESIDILRGIALFGVLAVNLLTEFRVSIFAQFTDAAEPAALDRAVMNIVHHALELKAFALFSFLFGVGLAMQYERLSATGKPLYWLTRRLLVLLVLGLVHLLLIWNGDILTEYALAGLIALPLLQASRRVLALAATGLFAAYLALPMLPLHLWPDPDWIARQIGQANAVYGGGNWFQVMRFSLQELPFLLPLHVYIFPRTLGLFVLGMLAWRSGLFAGGARRKAALARLGWALGIAGMTLALADENRLSQLAPVCLALAFAALVVYAVHYTASRALLRMFSAIGRMAFTNYIAQSLVFGWIFFGYGLGQFGRLPAAPVLALGIAVYAIQIQLSMVWLRHHRFGPIEWLWRTLMYGRRQAMRR